MYEPDAHRTGGPRPLDLQPLFRALARHRVEYVLTGSVGAMLHGVELVPGDLDIAPALDGENLERLARLLGELGAKPKFVPSWSKGPSEDECARWSPDPATEQHLDHRFVTPHGELDVVPRHGGTYEKLAPRAVTITAFGHEVRVAHVDDLIALCAKWNRDTDRRRVPLLEAVRDRSEGR
jgi:hypothetical protein